MERINTIALNGVLPRAFSGGEERARFSGSDVFLSNFKFERGTNYCLNATSGMGKTSLCSFIFGARTDYEGRILFNDTDVSSYDILQWCEVRRGHLAYLPQELDIFDELTALDNVLLKNRLTDYRTEAEIRQMFHRLEIENRLDFPAGRMSVGQRQRVAVIRAICQPFDFIMLDEPVSHLDEANNRICSEMIVEAAQANEAGVIFTSVGNPLLLPAEVVQLTL